MTVERNKPIGAGHWWQRLSRPGGGAVPPSVVERIGWYEKQVRRHRQTTYALEVATILVSAAIPAAAAAKASLTVLGVLGAIVTALAGLRQLLRSNENWIRFSATLVAMQRELVAWSVATDPYDGPDADASLATAIESLVGSETSEWTTLRANSQPTPAPPA
jgi:hypothetical protein